jgi:hypothetical protein
MSPEIRSSGGTSVATGLESGSIPWTHLVVWNKHWVKAIKGNIDTSQTGPTMFLFKKN